ncbi:protein rep [Pseudonocardia sp. ICBG1142]|uniref:protein rep n=1 Tax=Pseudonocardia sp. ICBG1142 TaxID=2846760 RepID=UPI001CF6CE0E|nr:protein rep [Pseudonocardia sp. ICBG1142]
MRCGTVWTCPECSMRISVERTALLGKVVTRHIEDGARVMTLTLTLRHFAEHELALSVKASRTAFSRVTDGRAGMRDYVELGLRGWSRSPDLTWGVENGWHLHQHVTVVFEPGTTDEQMTELAEGWFTRWSRGAVAAGMPAPDREHGLDFEILPDGDTEAAQAWAAYQAKGIAAEQLMAGHKKAKGISRTIGELIHDATIGRTYENPDTGQQVQMVDLQAQELLREFEKAIKGVPQMTWSRGKHDLRNILSEEEKTERSDEEIVDDDSLDGEEVAVIPRESWPQLQPRVPEFLSIIEREGTDAARAWLDANGIGWEMPTRLTDTRRRGVRPGSEI